MKNGRWFSAARASIDRENGHQPIARNLTALCAALAALVLLPTMVSAKKQPPVLRSISGEVMDSASNGVDGATVELTDLDTNKKLAIYTLNGGHYAFTGLDPHHDYRVQAKYKGKASRVHTVSSIDPFNQIVINLTLTPAKQ
ncbi:MAG: carboxypeptidase-like regulatory domain-containing protein [Terriglobia bacterium]